MSTHGVFLKKKYINDKIHSDIEHARQHDGRTDDIPVLLVPSTRVHDHRASERERLAAGVAPALCPGRPHAIAFGVGADRGRSGGVGRVARRSAVSSSGRLGRVWGGGIINCNSITYDS